MRLLSDPLPLRVAADLPRYRADAAGRVLPWVYGRVTLAPVPLDDAGLEWLVADHPVVAVESVRSAGKALDGWQLVQRLDETGRAIATIRLTRAPEDDLAVQVVGRRDDASGALLEHPAAIAADLLRRCGWTPAADAFQGLRDDFPGVVLGMVFAERETRLRGAIAQVIEPLGAVWVADPPAARRRTIGAPVATLDVRAVEDITAEARSDDLVTVVRADFAWDWSASGARQAVTAAAPDAVQVYGRLEGALDMPAVRAARDALAIAQSRLSTMARPCWTIRVTVPATLAIAPGDTVALDHPRVPAGAALVLSTTRDRDRGTLEVVAWMPAGSAPRVEMTQRAQAIDAARPTDSVTYRDGVATFTVTDPAGNPLSGAAVTLDGQQTRETDAQGRVHFRTERGAHTLAVYRAGYQRFEMGVFV
jgi:hypothetical protein